MQSGPEQLKAWIDRAKLNQRKTAEYLGFDETYVSQLLGEKRTPGLDNALLIERMTGIPVEAWASFESDRTETAVATNDGKRRCDKA